MNNTRNYTIIFLLAAFFVLSSIFVYTTPAQATIDITGPPPTSQIGHDAIEKRLENIGGLQGTGFKDASPIAIAASIVRSALILIGLIFFTLLIYAGAMQLTASGNEERAKQSTSIAKNAFIGLLVVIFAGAIAQFIVGRLDRIATPTTYIEGGPDYIDTGLLGTCPEGYTYVWDVPDAHEATAPGAACERL